MAEPTFAPLLPFTKRLREARKHEEELAASNPHLMQALTANKRQGQKLAIYARWAALSIIAIMLPFLNAAWSVLYYEAILLTFALLGWAQMKVGQVGQSRLELLLLFCDLALMTITIMVPNPFFDQQWPIAIQYRFGNFQYFFILLAGATLAYSWRTIFAVGTWAAGLWATALLVVVFFAREVPELTEKISVALADYPLMLEFVDPNSPQFGVRIQEVVVFLIVTGILALNGWRNNQLLLNQADMARERANLARHFPPSLVDQMAERDQPLGVVRSQPVAIMFTDIVGFTGTAEQKTPEEVIALLREFHTRMERAVFNNHGTLDKFLGDGIMASFGTPEPGPDDAANSLRCAEAMLGSIDEWNAARRAAGDQPIKLSIGIHYGDVILGDIGSKRRLEYATLGDTVNVASRLEELTRSLDTQLIVSDDVVKAVNGKENSPEGELLSDFDHAGNKVLRGRDREIGIWRRQASQFSTN